MLGWRKCCLVVASIVLLGVSVATAADNKPFLAALKAVGDAASQQQLHTLALMVRVDPGSEAESDVKQSTASLRDEVEAVLETAGFKLHVLTATPPALAPFLPEDLGRLKAAQGDDGLVCVDYKKTPRTRTARITLVTSDKKLFTRITAISEIVGLNAAANGRPQPGSRRRKSKDSSIQTGSQMVQRGGGTLAGMGTSSALLGSSVANSLGATGGTSTAASTTATNSTISTTGTTVPSLNKAILAFAVEKIGQQVGDGECAALAVEALKATDAKPNDGYVWGTPVDIADMQPGDIIQFTSAIFVTPTMRISMGAPNHTAISYTMTAGKGSILQQNFNGDRTVSTFEMDLSTLTSGSIQVYRAQRADGTSDPNTPGAGTGSDSDSDTGTEDGSEESGGKRCHGKAARGAVNVTVVVNINIGSTGSGASTGGQACAGATGGTTTGGTTTVTTP